MVRVFACNKLFFNHCFGNTRFKNTAVIVAIQRGTFPKIVVTHAGKLPALHCLCHTHAEQLIIQHCCISKIHRCCCDEFNSSHCELMQIQKRLLHRVHSGIVVSTEENFGINPAIQIIMADCQRVFETGYCPF